VAAGKERGRGVGWAKRRDAEPCGRLRSKEGMREGTTGRRCRSRKWRWRRGHGESTGAACDGVREAGGKRQVGGKGVGVHVGWRRESSEGCV
jgi:hypothetical protein